MKSALALAASSICAAVVLSCAPANAATAATRNYDCSKAGNAGKAACKGTAPASQAKPKPAPVVAGKPAPVVAAKPAAVVTAKPATAPRTMNYDCTKPGNRMKVACKGAVAATPAPAPSAPAARPAPRVAVAAAPAPKMAPRVPTPAPSSGGRVVAWTEKNGKVVHYDCSKAGNATKQACK